jgi:protein SCO1/2
MSAHAPDTAAAPDPPPSEPERPRRGGLSAKVLLPLIVIGAILGGVTALIAGNSSKKQSLPGNVTTTAGASNTGPANANAFAGNVITTPIPAPGLGNLHNYNGASVNLAAYRGDAVFVTFLYTHCPDVCPLIASSMHTAYTMLAPGQASHVRLITVSVDPRGDNAPDVAAFVHRHQLDGEMQYLIGSASQLVPVWTAWHVGSQRDAQSPQYVNHSGLVYGVSASGKITTIYAANFNPRDVAHDVTPLLAS